MQWFNEKEFYRVKGLIDSGDHHAVKQWYFEDFKNNTTTTFLAYVYAVDNRKSEKVINTLGQLLFPEGKTTPLEYKDVISELYQHLSPTKWSKIKDIILSHPFMKFELKSADTITAFFEDPELSKVLSNYPSIISKYLKSEDKIKIYDKLISSDNYEIVKKALSNSLFSVSNNGNTYGLRKQVWEELWSSASKIKNKEIRRKFLMEEVYNSSGLKLENLYNKCLLTDYSDGVFDITDLNKLANNLKISANGNGGVAKLLAKILEKDGKKAANDFIQHSVGVFIIGILVTEINNRPFANGEKRFGPELESEFIFNFTESITDPKRLLLLVQGGDEKFVSELVSTFPELLDSIMEQYPKKVPKNISDVFIF